MTGAVHYKRKYDLLLREFKELQEAAQKVCDEAHHIHDTEPFPVKYRAPYGAIVEMTKLLARQYGCK